MPISFSCTCGKTLRANDEVAGKRVKCPGCGTAVVVPARPTTASSLVLTQQKSRQAIIEIRRVKKYAGSFRSATVFMDREEVGSLGSGETQSFEVSPGYHTVEVAIGSVPSPAFEVTVQAGQSAIFECEFRTGFAATSLDLRCTRKPGSVREAPSRQPPRSKAGMVLFYGMTSFLIGIAGLVALGVGISELQKRNKGEIDSSGRGLVVAGMILGVIGCGLNFTLLILHFSGTIKLF